MLAGPGKKEVANIPSALLRHVCQNVKDMPQGDLTNIINEVFKV